jgi:hypothetical protein
VESGIRAGFPYLTRQLPVFRAPGFELLQEYALPAGRQAGGGSGYQYFVVSQIGVNEKGLRYKGGGEGQHSGFACYGKHQRYKKGVLAGVWV